MHPRQGATNRSKSLLKSSLVTSEIIGVTDSKEAASLKSTWVMLMKAAPLELPAQFAVSSVEVSLPQQGFIACIYNCGGGGLITC